LIDYQAGETLLGGESVRKVTMTYRLNTTWVWETWGANYSEFTPYSRLAARPVTGGSATGTINPNSNMKNPNCRSGCKTQDHESYSDCLQAANFGFAGCFPSRQGWDKDKEKNWDKELDSYYSAVRQGVEPISTKQKDIDAAMMLSNEAGKAFDGNTMKFKEN